MKQVAPETLCSKIKAISLIPPENCSNDISSNSHCLEKKSLETATRSIDFMKTIIDALGRWSSKTGILILAPRGGARTETNSCLKTPVVAKKPCRFKGVRFRAEQSNGSIRLFAPLRTPGGLQRFLKWTNKNLKFKLATMKSKNVVSVRPPYPGYLFKPSSPGPHSAIFLLHGSEGGNGNYWSMPGDPAMPTGADGFVPGLARDLAELGYVTYALSYFHADPNEKFDVQPPKELVDVDLKYTMRALKWFSESELVQGKPIGIMGGSRGGEHALILSSLLNHPESILSFKPAFVLAEAAPGIVAPGFSLEAAAAISNGGEFPEEMPNAWKFGDKDFEMYSTIEVEKIEFPQVVIYGAQDELCGPDADAFLLHERLLKNNRSSRHFDYYNSQNPETVFKEIESLLSSSAGTAIFVRLMDEGHFPRPGSSSALLRTKVRDLVIKEYLPLN